jgi:hypothetical protein
MTVGYKRPLVLVMLLAVVLAGCDPSTGMPGPKTTTRKEEQWLGQRDYQGAELQCSRSTDDTLLVGWRELED